MTAARFWTDDEPEGNGPSLEISHLGLDWYVRVVPAPDPECTPFTNGMVRFSTSGGRDDVATMLVAALHSVLTGDGDITACRLEAALALGGAPAGELARLRAEVERLQSRWARAREHVALVVAECGTSIEAGSARNIASRMDALDRMDGEIEWTVRSMDSGPAGVRSSEPAKGFAACPGCGDRRRVYRSKKGWRTYSHGTSGEGTKQWCLSPSTAPPIPDRTIRKIDQRTRPVACAHCGEPTCPTEATPTPSICGDCCDCLAGTCPKCGAFEEELQLLGPAEEDPPF